MNQKLDAALQESEQAKIRLRDDIFAILAASGYHRARIDQIDEYDRITGGIAWAIKRYADVEVNANLLYEESAERKIALRTEQSEEIIKALRAIKSPFELSAHQLQGLDYGALKNVIQWLIRRLLIKNQRKTNRHKNLRNWIVSDRQEKDTDSDGLRRRNDAEITTRYRRRMDKNIKFDLNLDAKCTLQEYLNYSGRRSEQGSERSEETEIGEDDRNLEEASSKKRVATKSIIQMLETATVDSSSTSPVPEVSLSEKLAQLEVKLADEKNSYLKVKKCHNELLEKLKVIEMKMEKTDEKEIEQITELLKSFHATELRAQELKNFELEEHPETEENGCNNGNIDSDTEKYRQYKNAIESEYNLKIEEFATSAREVQSLQFELDQLLNVNLSSHYRKRNMERLQNSADYTEEAKAAVIDYNVTIDILKFSGRITNFINELESNLMKEPATQEYREAFVSYMNEVRTQLGEYHWKAKQGQEKTIQEKKMLEEKRSEIRRKEREMATISRELKKLLEINAKLQEITSSM